MKMPKMASPESAVSRPENYLRTRQSTAHARPRLSFTSLEVTGPIFVSLYPVTYRTGIYLPLTRLLYYSSMSRRVRWMEAQTAHAHTPDHTQTAPTEQLNNLSKHTQHTHSSTRDTGNGKQDMIEGATCLNFRGFCGTYPLLSGRSSQSQATATPQRAPSTRPRLALPPCRPRIRHASFHRIPHSHVAQAAPPKSLGESSRSIYLGS